MENTTDNLRKKIGAIDVSSQLILMCKKEALVSLFSKFYPIRILVNQTNPNTLRYIGFCEDFDEVENEYETPIYEATLKANEDETFLISFTKQNETHNNYNQWK